MRVDIGGGVRLYVDVDGMGLVPVEGKLVQRPTLVLLHGGPGFDHAQRTSSGCTRCVTWPRW